MKNLLFSFICVLAFTSVNAQKKEIIKIAAVGDIMLGTYYPDSSYLPRKGSFRLFKNVQSELNDADITFGNLEGVLTDDTTQVKKCVTEGRCYYFAMPTSYAQTLANAGFDFISLANNHINDFGYVGQKSTKKSLRKQKIRFAGLLDCPVDTLTRDSILYGFCAFAPNATTLNIKDIKKAERTVSYLKSFCDIVIVSFHAGGEGVDYQNITRETEYYINENRGNVHLFAHRMIDAGADVLLGHGPHVTRAVEIYKNRFIAYSLGNFLTYSRVSIAGKCGIAPLMHIYTNNMGEFVKARIIPTYQKKYQATLIDPQNRAIKIIQELTKTDFPEMKDIISISDDGWIEMVKE